jgi:hypothetical protein
VPQAGGRLLRMLAKQLVLVALTITWVKQSMLVD